MAPRTQVHPQHHNPTLMSTVTTQNLRLTTTKTQITTYTSRSSKPRPKSVMLLLHKSNPKPIDWLYWWQIEDVGGGYGFGEWGGAALEWRRSVGGRRTFNKVWGGATSICHRCVGVDLKGFVAVAFSWNWNWRACEAEGCEFWGKWECRERIRSLKKWK